MIAKNSTTGDKPWDQINCKVRALLLVTIGVVDRPVHAQRFPQNVETLGTKDFEDCSKRHLSVSAII